jgi:hypothetical protein
MRQSKTDSHIIFIFYLELIQQCRFAKLSIEDISTYSSPDKHSSERIYYAIQNFLTSLGIISTILWPTKHKERGYELRKKLKVRDDSVLRNRKFRNHFIHFNERVENWAEAFEIRGFSDWNIGSWDGVSLPSELIRVRTFDPKTWMLTFRDEEFNLLPAVKAIDELYDAVQSKISQPGKKRN